MDTAQAALAPQKDVRPRRLRLARHPLRGPSSIGDLVRRRVAAAPVLALILLAARLAAQTTAPDSQRAGWLLLEGGGRLRGTDIVTRFVALAGGPDRNYVAIPSAISDSESRPSRLAHCASASAEIFGVAHVTCLAAKDRDEAGGAAFVAALRAADAVWFYGGEENRLVDLYVGTPVVAALRAVLDRGGVVGGTSAGAMVLSSYIPTRGTLAVSAFGFLDSTAIYPHFTQRHYEEQLRDVLRTHPALRGIGIDENTAIVVHAGTFEVIGEGSVTVLRRQRTVLTAGQRFDLHGSPQ